MNDALTPSQSREVDAQVDAMLARSQAFQQMSPRERSEIRRHTSSIVQAMAARPHDPYAMPLEGKVIQADKRNQPKPVEFGAGAAKGVELAAQMINTIDFPKFVANLVQGTFHAIVESSIEQMKAYAELVKSVAQSLTEFRDENVSENQGRDHLVSRYPNLFQINVVNGQPKVGTKDGASDGALPDFAKDFGLSEAISSLDDDMIEEKLVPAARDDLARNRQQLLATIVLMGINRIVVTDGKINAKVRFEFKAQDRTKQTASAYDFYDSGQSKRTWKGDYESNQQEASSSYNYSQGAGSAERQGGSQYAKGTYTGTEEPDIRVSSEVHTDTTASFTASGQIMGEVSINFRSETFPLEKLVNTDQMTLLNNAQRSGPRGAGAAPQAPGAKPAASPAPASSPAPAAAPAPTTARA